MSSDNAPNLRAAIIALSAVGLALAGGLWQLNEASGDTAPSSLAAATIGCSGFEAAAHRLFDQGDTAALRGTFAPGDHVHLAIAFKGIGYSWGSTGVLAKAPRVFGSVWYTTNTTSTYDYPPVFLSMFKSASTSHTSTTTATLGDANVSSRLELDIDITTAGDGTITINRPGGAPSFTVVSASCSASKKA